MTEQMGRRNSPFSFLSDKTDSWMLALLVLFSGTRRSPISLLCSSHDVVLNDQRLASNFSLQIETSIPFGNDVVLILRVVFFVVL